jgi:hypothetical protein
MSETDKVDALTANIDRIIVALAEYATTNAMLAESNLQLAAGLNQLADAIAAPIEDIDTAQAGDGIERDFNGNPV